MVRLAGLLLVALTCCGAAAMEIRVDVKSGIADIYLSGRIGPRDPERLRRVLAQNDVRAATMRRTFVHSDGGDVDAAMRVGRALREADALVHVDGTCVSSCVLILASGVSRWVMRNRDARVGVHRLYFAAADPAMSTADARRRYVAVRQRVAGYLEEMGIASELLTLMESTPPESIRYLNENELTLFRLEGADPGYEETLIAKLAYQYGLSSATYRERLAKVERMCGPWSLKPDPKRADCEGPLMYGLSPSEYQQRQDRFSRALLALASSSKPLDVDGCIRVIMVLNAANCE